MRQNKLIPVYVETMPQVKEHGILYISKKFELAIHLCACGCGGETVMPFDGFQSWELSGTPERVTFRPSVGNQHWPCGSHYYITENAIVWL